MSSIHNFELIASFKAFEKYPTFQYKCRTSGLTVVFSDHQVPLIECDFCVVTEPLEDNGAPYALQRLIFAGSQRYPYKNCIDLLTNRTLTSNNRGYTNTTYTCFEFTTHNQDDLLTFLPIYLDHILAPLLPEAAFSTEIHHVRPDGTDDGDVYCEVKNDEDFLTMLQTTFLKTMYPNCGYATPKLGVSTKIRDSLNIDKIREFHKRFYTLANLKIIITGRIHERHEEILQILTKIEHVHKFKTFEKPWQQPVAPLTESSDLRSEFAVEDATKGACIIGWRGPDFITEQYLFKAVYVVFKYFYYNVIAREFVENSQPYADCVGYDYLEYPESCFYVTAFDVPLEKLPKFKPKLFQLFENIVHNKTIDVDAIRSTIERTKRHILEDFHYNPNSTLSLLIIEWISHEDNNLEQHLNPLSDYDRLLNESQQFWIDLIQKYLLESHHVAIQGVPNSEKYQQFIKDEEQLIKKRLDNLICDDLNEIGENLEQLKIKQEPNEFFKTIKIPEFQPNFYQIERYNSGSCEELERMPVFTYFDRLESELVYIYTSLNTDGINEEQRQYLPLIAKLIFNSPIIRNNEIISSEQFHNELEDDINAYQLKFGVLSQFSNTISIRFEIELIRFRKAIQYLHDILFNLKLTEQQVAITLDNLKVDINNKQQSYRYSFESIKNQILFKPNCNINIDRHYQFLLNLKNFDGIDRLCHEIWTILAKPENIILHIVGDLNVGDLQKYFNDFLPETVQPCRQLRLPTSDTRFLNDFNGASIAYFVKNTKSDRNYFEIIRKSIDCVEDPDLAALLIVLQYFSDKKRDILKFDLNNGLLTLTFYSDGDILERYFAIKKLIIDQIIDKNWNYEMINAAKRSKISELCDKETYITDFTVQLIVSNFENIDYTHNRKLINCISTVTVDDLNRVGEKYILPLFCDKANLAVIVSNGSTNVDDLKRLNFKLIEYSAVA